MYGGLFGWGTVPPPFLIGFFLSGVAGWFGSLLGAAYFAPELHPPAAVALIGSFVGMAAFVVTTILIAGIREAGEKVKGGH